MSVVVVMKGKGESAAASVISPAPVTTASVIRRTFAFREC
jgi:hypothetical protein